MENKMDNNILSKTTELAKAICEKYADKTKTAIDATCGKGNDTIWLAERFGKVYAFDIQQSATEVTGRLVESSGFDNVTVINDGHEKMAEYVPERVGLVMFNLGYLPGGDKNVVTERTTTLEAIEAALSLLEKDGLVCITMYPGHPQGAAERKAVLEVAASLDKGRYHCIRTDMVNQPHTAPEILFITLKVGQ